jgi:hypothetical protein
MIEYIYYFVLFCFINVKKIDLSVIKLIQHTLYLISNTKLHNRQTTEKQTFKKQTFKKQFFNRLLS